MGFSTATTACLQSMNLGTAHSSCWVCEACMSGSRSRWISVLQCDDSTEPYIHQPLCRCDYSSCRSCRRECCPRVFRTKQQRAVESVCGHRRQSGATSSHICLASSSTPWGTQPITKHTFPTQYTCIITVIFESGSQVVLHCAGAMDICEEPGYDQISVASSARSGCS